MDNTTSQELARPTATFEQVSDIRENMFWISCKGEEACVTSTHVSVCVLPINKDTGTKHSSHFPVYDI